MMMNRKNRSAFATVFALVSLTLVGVTIGGLTTRIAMQARRTNQEIRRAQLDQIRIATSLAADKNALVLPNELKISVN